MASKTKKETKKEKPSQSAGDGVFKAIDLAVKKIKEKYGEGSIMKLGEAKRVDVDVISTGSISLDLALGVGGIPRGRVVEIYGPESAGKSTLALHIVAEAQKKGGIAAFVDAEHALDPEYAKNIGVKINDLLISQPDNGEQALEIVDTLVRSGAVDVIIIDSVAALTPRVEIEGEMDQQHIGLQARLMSHALRKLTAIIGKSNTSVIFLNQIRHKIGVFFGNPETTPGGMALKFYSSVRIEIRRAAKIESMDKIVGNRVKVKIVKNKVAAPFRTAEFDILYDEGISRASDMVNTGTQYGVVQKAGAWYSFGDQRLGQGVEGARQFIKENPKIEKQILSAIQKAVAQEA